MMVVEIKQLEKYTLKYRPTAAVAAKTLIDPYRTENVHK